MGGAANAALSAYPLSAVGTRAVLACHLGIFAPDAASELVESAAAIRGAGGVVPIFFTCFLRAAHACGNGCFCRTIPALLAKDPSNYDFNSWYFSCLDIVYLSI